MSSIDRSTHCDNRVLDKSAHKKKTKETRGEPTKEYSTTSKSVHCSRRNESKKTHDRSSTTITERTNTKSASSNTTTTTDAKIPTTAYYKRTREEALKFEHTIPNYELFDLETGFMKEKYRRLRSPPPPSGTTVFAVGSGKPHEFIPGMSLMRIYPGSLAMYKMRQEAAEAGVLPDHLKPEEDHEQNDGFDDEDDEPRRERVKRKKRPATNYKYISSSSSGSSSSSNSSTLKVQKSSESVPTGSLRRVIPKLIRLRGRKDNNGGVSTSSGFCGYSIHTVQKQQTTTTVTPRPDGPTTSDRSFQIETCNCVALVTADSIRIDLDKPDLEHGATGEPDELTTTESPTLRYLRFGYRNYVENNITDEVHVMTAYTCRSLRLKLYNVYKSILCKSKRNQPSVHSDPPTPGTSSGGGRNQNTSELNLYKTMANINQYLNVFSALADFNYTWMTPALKGGICNAMVVDKRWTYSPVRQVYLPSYRLFSGDCFTDFAVSEIRNLNNKGTRIKYVRFLSTSNTVVYTNRRALFNCGDTNDYYLDLKKRLDAVTVTSVANEDKDDSRGQCIPKPPKKRRFVPEGENTTATTTTKTDTTIAQLDSGIKPTRQDLDCTAADGKTSQAKNPTLVVFKHNLDEGEPDTLVCNIILEMDLANRIEY